MKHRLVIKAIGTKNGHLIFEKKKKTLPKSNFIPKNSFKMNLNQ